MDERGPSPACAISVRCVLRLGVGFEQERQPLISFDCSRATLDGGKSSLKVRSSEGRGSQARWLTAQHCRRWLLLSGTVVGHRVALVASSAFLSPSAGFDDQRSGLELSLLGWGASLSTLGGECTSLAAQFRAMPEELDDEDLVELHRRAVG